MKLTVLMENTACDTKFAAEHGLSLYVETGDQKILFDMGDSPAFADNAKLLGVDLSQVDVGFLSHGHYDHSGGLWRFFEVNDKAPVYVSATALGQYYHGDFRYIGVDQALENHPRLRLAPETMTLPGNMTLCTCNDQPAPYPLDSAGLTEKCGCDFVADTFHHEQYLVVEENGRRIVFSGCSHKGILNIVEWLKPDILIGGFHFMNEDLSAGHNDRLDQAAQVLLSHNTTYYTCHCTGVEQYQYLKQSMGDALQYLTAGQVLSI